MDTKKLDDLLTIEGIKKILKFPAKVFFFITEIFIKLGEKIDKLKQKVNEYTEGNERKIASVAFTISFWINLVFWGIIFITTPAPLWFCLGLAIFTTLILTIFIVISLI